MTSLRPRLLSAAVVLSALLGSAIASADVGTITLSTGEVISGEIQQVVKGEYVIVQMPGGEVKAIAWAQIGQIAIGGSITVGGGTAPPPKPATPPPTYTPPPPTYTGGPTVYAPPPPPPAYGPPPPMPVPRPVFQPAFMLGIRIGQINPGGTLVDDSGSGSSVDMSQYAKSGWSFEGDVGLHFSPSWTFYGFWEYGQLGRANTEKQTESPVTNAVGLGLNANTSPNGPIGFVADIALGYRWFSFQQNGTQSDGAGGFFATTEKYTFGGVMPLRLGLGLAIQPTRKVRIDLMGQVSVSSFSQRTGGTDCPSGCSIDSTSQGTNTFTGLTAGIRWDL